MQNKISTSTIKKFLAWAFGLGWIVMAVFCYLNLKPDTPIVIRAIFSLLTMFTPSIAALLSKAPIKEVGWRPHLIKKWKPYVAIWLWVALYTVFGAVVYFAVFPQHFSLDFASIAKSIGSTDPALLHPAVWKHVFMALTVYSLLITLPGLGEELGWRGVLYPYLKERYGRTKGRIIGGLIWASWHLPILIFLGSNSLLDRLIYAITYYIMAVATGILLDIYYVKSKSIWLPAFGHSIVDVVGPLNGLFIAGNVKAIEYFGPGFTGLFVDILAVVVVVWLTKRETREIQQVSS